MPEIITLIFLQKGQVSYCPFTRFFFIIEHITIKNIRMILRLVVKVCFCTCMPHYMVPEEDKRRHDVRNLDKGEKDKKKEDF